MLYDCWGEECGGDLDWPVLGCASGGDLARNEEKVWERYGWVFWNARKKGIGKIAIT